MPAIEGSGVALDPLQRRLVGTEQASGFSQHRLPVLFYLAILLAVNTNIENVVLLVLAWAFVALRFLHSYIHCTYNRVKDRFTAYLFGGIALWALWVILAYQFLLR